MLHAMNMKNARQWQRMKATSANNSEVRSMSAARRMWTEQLPRALSKIVSVEAWLVSGGKDSYRELAVARSQRRIRHGCDPLPVA